MPQRQKSICELLRRREMGIQNRNENFSSTSTRIVDKLLVHSNEIKTIPCIDDRSRSSYMAVTNTKGIAAMTHSNRCISLIDTGTMKRIAEINGLTRTVWTLCFHPHDPNLLATGDLGGTVCVFYETKMIQSKSNDTYPVTSISFHAREPLIFYSIDNRIVLWNYHENVKIHELFAMEESRIKYVKYNPANDMLITGIRRENQISFFGIADEPDENHETRLISCSSFFDHLLRSLSSIIDNIDPNSFVNLSYYWTHILNHTESYFKVLQSCDTVQLRPVKFIGDFNISLVLMKSRVHQIAQLLFQKEYFSNDEILDNDLIWSDDEFKSIRGTLKALEYIIQVYRSEVKQFKSVDNLEFRIMADIILTIHQMLCLPELSSLIRQNIKRSDLYQYRLQAWTITDMQEMYLPDFAQNWRNLITYCYIHNDSTVELSKCGTMIASFEVASTEKIITVHSLQKSTLGQYVCSYALNSEEILMSLSFSPSSEYLLVGVRSSKIFGCFLKISRDHYISHNTRLRPRPKWIHTVDTDEGTKQMVPYEEVVMLKQCQSNPDLISYLKWSARCGDGIIVGYKTYQLRCILRR